MFYRLGCLNDKDIGPLMRWAYCRTATLELAANGFRKCGIYPFDPLVFTSHDFSHQQTRDRPIERPRPTTSEAANQQTNEEVGWNCFFLCN